MNDNEAKLAAAVGRIKGVTVEEAAIRAHVMRPQQVVGAVSDRGSEDAPRIQVLPPQPGLSYELNIQGFIDALQSALTNLTAGYSLRLRETGWRLSPWSIGTGRKNLRTVARAGRPMSGCMSPASARS